MSWLFSELLLLVRTRLLVMTGKRDMVSVDGEVNYNHNTQQSNST